jgi:hypothetical protein
MAWLRLTSSVSTIRSEEGLLKSLKMLKIDPLFGLKAAFLTRQNDRDCPLISGVRVGYHVPVCFFLRPALASYFLIPEHPSSKRLRTTNIISRIRSAPRFWNFVAKIKSRYAAFGIPVLVEAERLPLFFASSAESVGNFRLG